MNLFAGSKTFLVGEYGVLFGGSCVVLITPPEFSLEIIKGETSLRGISKLSPGYRFYKCHEEAFKNFSIKFSDPYNGKGGFGASSAQYSLLYKAYLKITSCQFDLDKFLDEYRDLASSNRGISPSGADCLAQFNNFSTYYDPSKKVIQQLEIDFPNLDFCIFKTKTKISTHEHLRRLPKINTNELNHISDQVYQSILSKNESKFCENLQKFFQELQSMKLVLSSTSDLVSEISNIPGVYVAKGCGALSADTILVIFLKSLRNEIIDQIRNVLNCR
ncbi:MAG: hypothetical protein E7015_03020 [Alphaproteobacteria bacterium]|nr:hypothetical protein [Alphaproteobacteria bacterium]